MVVVVMEHLVEVVRSHSWCSMLTVRSHSWCSMLIVVEVAMVKHDTTHLADHQNVTSHPNVRTTPATLMPLET